MLGSTLEPQAFSCAYTLLRAPYFGRYLPMLQKFYSRSDELLVDFTISLTIAIAAELGINKTRYLRSSEMGIAGGKSERLVKIVQAVGANRYLSGPSAKDYIEQDCFDRADIDVEYINYDYPEYPQLHPPFDPRVTVLDLLFMMGPSAPQYIWPNGMDRK